MGLLAATPTPASNPPETPWSIAELQALVDEVMHRQLREAPIAGAAVTVVKDGGVLLNRGYGYADLDSGRLVDPERTLFRMGSISKTLTAIAVMQQVEQGRLDLDQNVNRYLKDFQIPDTFPQPVTLRHLLTHTAGFDVTATGFLLASGPERIRPLGQVLTQHMPARIRPPSPDFGRGTDAAYCNWCLALAGHIVARSSQRDFDRYIEQQLLQPLGMHNSSFAEPLPPQMQAQMSRGYLPGTPMQAIDFEYFHNVGPAGSLSATPSDMARYMLSQLQGGQLDDQRILGEAATRLMHSRILTPAPQINGAGLGWMHMRVNGRGLIWHGGKTVAFFSEMYLLPEARLGLLVVYNTQPPVEFRGELLHRLMDRYFPPSESSRPSKAAKTDLQRLTGHYAPVPLSTTTWEKLLTLVTSFSLNVEDQSLHHASPAMGPPARLLALNGSTFRDANNGDVMSFSQGDDGRLYLLGPHAFAPYVRLSRWETPAFNAAALLLFGASFIWAGVNAWRHRNVVALRRLRSQAAWLAGCALLSLLCLLLTLLRDPVSLLAELPWTLWLGLSLGLLSLPLCLLLLGQLLKNWRNPQWSRGQRAAYSCFVLLTGCFLLWLHHWNLLGFHLA